MSSPGTVVIPFGVPAEGRGMGLGLAALMHVCLPLGGSGLAIAQLHGRRNDDPEGSPPTPVESFVPPAAFKEMAGRGQMPTSFAMVLTGAFEPPFEGHGAIQMLVFDAADGKERARIEAPLDGVHAGASLVSAVEQLCARVGGDLGVFGAMRELEWDALEGVLRAERCVLRDPLRGGPHDLLAAMLHLGRAIGDAPAASYPCQRLAAIALEAAMGSPLDARMAASAARALARAVEDAPSRMELVEAFAALEVRLGRARDAEKRLNAALAVTPERVRLYALLAQALRAQGNLDAALAALDSAPPVGDGDGLLDTERGVVLAARGDLAGASEAWRKALLRDPVLPAAFTHLAALAMHAGDAETGQSLVDAALGAHRAHPDVLRRAVTLALATEGEGIARASRVRRLCGRLLEIVPEEHWAALAMARAEAALGEVSAARVRLTALDQVTPESAVGAEAQLTRLSIEEPEVHEDIQRMMRAAQSTEPEGLEQVAVRARSLATLHPSWLGWVAAAVADRRRGRRDAARAALEVALEMAPGAVLAHIELSEVLVELGDAVGALEHAERALTLAEETPRARRAKSRALQALAESSPEIEEGWRAKLRGMLGARIKGG
jgi:tetratricopeptide (TPR) repeat protein